MRSLQIWPLGCVVAGKFMPFLYHIFVLPTNVCSWAALAMKREGRGILAEEVGSSCCCCMQEIISDILNMVVSMHYVGHGLLLGTSNNHKLNFNI